MTTVFIVLAIVFVAFIIIWAAKWNKKEETPHVSAPTGNVVNDGMPESFGLTERPEFKIISVGYGRDGELRYNGTYYEGIYEKGQKLILGVNAVNLQKIVCLTGKNRTPKAFPAIQMQVLDSLTSVSDIAEIATSKREYLLSKAVGKGDTFYLTADVLPWDNKELYSCIRLQYRVNNGKGYGDWQNVDVVNIHKLK